METTEPFAILNETEITEALLPVVVAVRDLHEKVEVRPAGFGMQMQININTNEIEQAIQDAARKLLAQITDQHKAMREKALVK